MSRGRPRTLTIRTPRQLRALRTPVRQEIVGAFRRLGASSVKEIAAEIGRAPETLYYHVHELVKAGIVREKSRRPAGKRVEAVYELTATRIIIDHRGRSKAFLSALADLYRATLRSAERELARALEQEQKRKRGPRRSTAVMRLTVRLSSESAQRLPGLLQEVVDSLTDEKEEAGARDYSLTVAVAELPERRDAV